MKKINREEVVYFEDLATLLRQSVDKIIYDFGCEQFWCQCFGTKDEPTCDCVLRKWGKNGKKMPVMHLGQLQLEKVRKTILDDTNKILGALKDRAVVCTCPPDVTTSPALIK